MADLTRDKELSALVEGKIIAIFRELEDADWKARDIALAMDQVIRRNWLDRDEALRQARQSLPKRLSDGNEG